MVTLEEKQNKTKIKNKQANNKTRFCIIYTIICNIYIKWYGTTITPLYFHIKRLKHVRLVQNLLNFNLTYSTEVYTSFILRHTSFVVVYWFPMQLLLYSPLPLSIRVHHWKNLCWEVDKIQLKMIGHIRTVVPRLIEPLLSITTLQ